MPLGWVPAELDSHSTSKSPRASFSRPAEERQHWRSVLASEPGLQLRTVRDRNGNPQDTRVVVGMAEPSANVVKAALRAGGWSSRHVGAAVPNREALESVEELFINVVRWLSMNEPSELVDGDAVQVIQGFAPAIPPPFRIDRIIFTPPEQAWGPYSRVEVDLIGEEELDDPEVNLDDDIHHWMRFMRRQGFNPDPPDGTPVKYPVRAQMTFPIRDGAGASSYVKISAMYCFDTQSWMLVRVEVQPAGTLGWDRPQDPVFEVQFANSGAATAIVAKAGRVFVVRQAAEVP